MPQETPAEREYKAAMEALRVATETYGNNSDQAVAAQDRYEAAVHALSEEQQG